jgi:phage shock protein A
MLLIVTVIILSSLTPVSANQSVYIWPSKGHQGSIVYVYGSGFTPNKDVTIYFDETPIATRITDENGRFWGDVQIPLEASPGDHVIKARDAEGKEAAARFKVTAPKFILNPSSGPMESLVEVRISGLTPHHEYSVLFDNIQLHVIDVIEGRSIVYGLMADDNGMLEFKVIIPAATKGVHNITLDYLNPYWVWWWGEQEFKPVVFKIPFNVTIGAASTSDILDVLTRISNLESRVSSLKRDLENMKVELLKAMNVTEEKLRSEIKEQARIVDELLARTEMLNKTLRAFEARLGDVNMTLSTGLNAISRKIEEQESLIAKLEEEKNTLKSNIEKLVGDLESTKRALGEDVGNVSKRVEKLGEDVGNVSKRVDEIGSRSMILEVTAIVIGVIALASSAYSIVKRRP